MSMVAVALVACASLSCNLFHDSSTSPSTPSTATDTFTGTVNQNGSVIFTFTVAQGGPVAVTLTALSPNASTAVGLGIGTPSGTTACTLMNSTSAAIAGATPQVTATEAAGTYCVKVYDVGNLTATSTVTVTVAHS
jgi:hypothetical protein